MKITFWVLFRGGLWFFSLNHKSFNWFSNQVYFLIWNWRLSFFMFLNKTIWLTKVIRPETSFCLLKESIVAMLFSFCYSYVMLFTLGKGQKFHQSAHFISSFLGLSVAVQFTCRITACFMSFMVREALPLWLISMLFTATKLLIFIMFDSFSCISCDCIKLA